MNKQKEATEKLLSRFSSGELIIKNGCEIYKKLKTGKIKRAEYPNSYGYNRVSIHIEGRPVFVMSHRLLYANHNGIESLEADKTIHHIDHNKVNNHPDNLEQISRSENSTEGVFYHMSIRKVNTPKMFKNGLFCRLEELINNSDTRKDFIAKKLGISTRQLRNYELQKSYIPMDKAYILADLLGVKVDDLYERNHTDKVPE